MTALPLKTSISDTYPNPSNATARAGFAQLWDAINETLEKPELDIASATTCDIGGQLSTKLYITGTTTITSFGTNYRGPILLRFAGALTITHNSTTLICPGGASITTAPGDVFVAWPKSTTSGTADGWQVVRLAHGGGIISIAEGGTGAGTASAARTALGLAYGPAFSAYAAADQSVTSGVFTKVTLDTEEEDTASCFASSRFTPNVAGYYFFSGSVRSYSATLTSVAASIAKNGGTVRSGDVLALSTATNTSMEASVSALIEMNGSSDFVELYGVVSGGAPVFDYNGGANSTSSFCGFLVRPT